MNVENRTSEIIAPRKLKQDLKTAFDYLDSKAGIKTERVLKATGIAVLSATAIGGASIAYNEYGPTTEIDHMVTEIDTITPTNTAIGAVQHAIDQLADNQGIDSNTVDNVTEAGNDLAYAQYMLPGTDISVTLEKKPFWGYEADASTLVDPIDTQDSDQ